MIKIIIERWKQHKALNIKVSNLGRIKQRSKILPQKVGQSGYFFVYIEGVGFRTVHNLVAETWLKKLNEDDTVDHIDSNRRNNCVSNLEYVTKAENQRRAEKNRIVVPYERLAQCCANLELNEDEAIELCKRYKSSGQNTVVKKVAKSSLPPKGHKIIANTGVMWFKLFLEATSQIEQYYDVDKMSSRIEAKAMLEQDYMGYHLCKKDNQIIGIRFV